MANRAKLVCTRVWLALAVVLTTGCYVEWEERPDKLEIVGGGHSSTDSLFDQRISTDPIQDARAFGFEFTLPDTIAKEGWYLRGNIKTNIATWSGYNQQLKVRERFTLTLSNSSFRFGIGKLVVAVYDADPSWRSTFEIKKKLGSKFNCEDTIMNGFAAITFKPVLASPVPNFSFTVFLNQPYFYRILVRGDVPALGVDFEQVLETFQLSPPWLE